MHVLAVSADATRPSSLVACACEPIAAGSAVRHGRARGWIGTQSLAFASIYGCMC
jgi:hypothetical protein